MAQNRKAYLGEAAVRDVIARLIAERDLRD